MRRIHALLTIATVLALAGSTSCGGGGDAAPSTDGGNTIYSGSFTPDNANPGANAVALGGQGSQNIVTLAVNVAGTNDVSGAAFDLTFDPSKAEFAGWSPGLLLEQGGHQVTYQLNSQQSGRVIVGVSRTTVGSGANAGIATPVVLLRMRVIGSGNSQIGFANADLLNSASPPGAKSGISFSGGTLVSN
jgi:hypothetical protein